MSAETDSHNSFSHSDSQQVSAADPGMSRGPLQGRAYNGRLGAQPPAGSRAKPPEVESLHTKEG